MSWKTNVRKFPMCAKSYTVGPQEYIRPSPGVCGTNASFFPLRVLWRTISAIESTPALLESKTNSRFYLSLANPPIERQVAAQFASFRRLTRDSRFWDCSCYGDFLADSVQRVGRNCLYGERP